MAAIPTNATIDVTNGITLINTITLVGADSLTYTAARDQILYLYNPTGAALTANLDGSNGTNISVPNTGGDVFDVSIGKDVLVASGETQAVRLKDVSAYLAGVVNVTGGVGLVAWISTTNP